MVFDSNKLCEGGSVRERSHPSLSSSRAIEQTGGPTSALTVTWKCVPGNRPEVFLSVTSRLRNIHLTPSFLQTPYVSQPSMVWPKTLAKDLWPCVCGSAWKEMYPCLQGSGVLVHSLIHSSFTRSGLCGGRLCAGPVAGTGDEEVRTDLLPREAYVAVRVMVFFKAQSPGGRGPLWAWSPASPMTDIKTQNTRITCLAGVPSNLNCIWEAFF